MTPAAHDALTLLLPPPALADWLGTTIAVKLSRGDKVPEAYMRWLYRVNMIRIGMPGVEVVSMTEEDWAAIVVMSTEGEANVVGG
jgi:hypothetical protein